MEDGSSALSLLSVYCRSMRFRERLLASIGAMQPVLDIPGVMVGGSQVPRKP